MPVHKSAVKRVRQSARRRLHNRTRRSSMRTLIKGVLVEKDKQQAVVKLSTATSLVDKLAKVGMIHRNRAATYKSRMALYVNSLN